MCSPAASRVSAPAGTGVLAEGPTATITPSRTTNVAFSMTSPGPTCTVALTSASNPRRSAPGRFAGGNSGSGFNGDFAEIFNRSGTPVDLTGWSFQSARVTDQGFDSRIAFLSGVINPGEYRLIVTNQLSPTGAVLPAADFTPATAFGMESSFGRVVLVASTVLVGTDYDRPDVVDLVGYGQLAQSFEGVAPTAALSNTLVAVRKNNGCQDTNQNAIDFDVVLALQLPRNSSTPASICPGVSICGCAADYNADGGVDGSDVGGFFADWEAAAGCSDVNQDGGVDGSDIEAFFAVWEQGGC